MTFLILSLFVCMFSLHACYSSLLCEVFCFFFQLGNSISTPLKRRKVNTHGTLIPVPSLSCQDFGSVILNCRSIRVGTLFRLLVEPVIVSMFLNCCCTDNKNQMPLIQSISVFKVCSIKLLKLIFKISDFLTNI